MVKVKKIWRVAIAVKDLDKGIENWKRLFGIEPFMYGEEPDQHFRWMAFNIGEGECTVEMFAPMDDPEGKYMIGKFLKTHGEGIYMMTLEADPDYNLVDRQIRELGLTPSWGEQGYRYEDAEGNLTSVEHYIHPHDANGVLITLESLQHIPPKVGTIPPAKVISFKQSS